MAARMQKFRYLRNTTPVLLAILVKGLSLVVAYALPFNLLALLTIDSADFSLLDFAPEIWLSLLAFVFGTLIIVISIASEKTPKLMDLFVAEYWSRLFIWIIALSTIENILLHSIHFNNAGFVANLIFFNNYIFLPSSVIAAIPYIFYILRFAKSSTVIRKIYEQNIGILSAARFIRSKTAVTHSHHQLFESINQLQDLLQYIQFKEPKADIIQRLGKSLRYYLRQKKHFPSDYFKLTQIVKSDISFRTLGEKYAEIEERKTFYEQKILRVVGTSYLLLIREGHYDLASLCSHELFASGRSANDAKDTEAVKTILIYFNTVLRYGINHGLKTREIRNVYNTIYHYSQLVNEFIDKSERETVLLCCKYFAFYANEVGKLSQTEPVFVFLIETFATELKKFLISLHINNFPPEIQHVILRMFNDVNDGKTSKAPEDTWIHNAGLRLIKIALCLFYIHRKDDALAETTLSSILKGLYGLSKAQIIQVLEEDCATIERQQEDFWEETDRGSRNIYYSEHRAQLGAFRARISGKLEEMYDDLSERIRL